MAELGHPVALDCPGGIDPKDTVLVAVKRDRFAVRLEILAGCVVVAAEMLIDLLAKAGATAVWTVAAGAMGWVLLRKYGWQSHTFRLRSEGA